MAAGFAAFTTKDEINRGGGRMVYAGREFFRLVAMMDAFHAPLGSAGLQANYGFDEPSAVLLGSAIGDSKQLMDIRNSLATLAVAKDFDFFAKQLLGLRP
jgi:hypothetical protein